MSLIGICHRLGSLLLTFLLPFLVRERQSSRCKATCDTTLCSWPGDLGDLGDVGPAIEPGFLLREVIVSRHHIKACSRSAALVLMESLGWQFYTTYVNVTA
ncbi:hypothetical protein BDP81DRAFT_414583 [Colletotrichum phormii]|uniref:Secreted protein n=1 Tax=Colletotrichum phormii TaxID=359342 RepID=A0AAJ0EP71_9PEZI|nr:uncharacterized protein BDP81DRAFT_414583 [Colletotrichum phormii]KAK1656314.1 hypothetical protein BDP81DRAFT_414583 [Colletotrichum phormii]